MQLAMNADDDNDASMGHWKARGQLVNQHPAVCPEKSDTCRPFAGIAISSRMCLAFDLVVEDLGSDFMQTS